MHASRRNALIALAILPLVTACIGAQISGDMRLIGEGAAAPLPGPTESIVLFMRPTEAFACCQASVFEVRDDAKDQLVGIIAPYTKVAYVTQPGKHFFMVVGEDASFLRAELLPGKTYYVRIYNTYEAQKTARYELKPVRPSEFEASWFRGLEAGDLIENTDESYKWADEHRDEIQLRKNERLRIWLDARDDPALALHPEDGR